MGEEARPLIIIPSNPAHFNCAGQNPPAWESPMAPVRGDFALAVTRLLPEMGVPVTTPTLKPRTFSGPKGSAPAGISLKR